VPGAFKESPLTVLGEAFMLLSNENTWDAIQKEI
jgi:hypothetical protein